MFQDPLVLDVVFLLHIGKGLIFVVTMSVVVYPKRLEVFLCNRIGDHIGEVPSCFYLGVFGIQCTFIALIFLFLCRVWGHDYPVVSWRSKICISLSIYLIFLSFSSYTRVFLSQSCIHVGFPRKIVYVHRFTENSTVCPDFLLFWEE